ncbi:NAD(P)-dependent oxidoreductase [Shewanella sp. KT0246]|uniref:NAD(P)-dependent oxidoreductase n=1 Tax=Shewanella sp. KT0246 TaxID=2815912 RepID=UPI001BC36CB8|nr:NAD(P)-dependent oxidoreductase [Shewanella sp. KT0246]GIU48444.1 hypothetical protein TUM4249_03750 [Shewanella sp. KT0246]
MMPITLTKPQRILIIGGGRAAEIKAKTALRYDQQVTLLAPEFSAECVELNCARIEADFYQCNPKKWIGFDLFYIALPWPSDLTQQLFICQVSSRLIELGKLVCVSCQPRLGNMVNPCSRSVGDSIIAVSGPGNDPKQTRLHTLMLSQTLSKFQQGQSIQ